MRLLLHCLNGKTRDVYAKSDSNNNNISDSNNNNKIMMIIITIIIIIVIVIIIIIIIITSEQMASRCCPCNGNSANCSCCICARSKRPCLSCRPLKSEKCLNTLRQRQQGGRAADNERRKTAPSPSDQTSSSGSAIVGVRGTQGEDANRVVVNQPERVKDTGSKQHVSNDLSNDDGLQSGSQVDIDALMKKAYGASLEGSSGHDNTGIWGVRWLRLLKLSRRLYSIPGGAIGRKYVNLLAEEVMHVVVGNYPSDRLIIFSAMMLQ